MVLETTSGGFEVFTDFLDTLGILCYSFTNPGGLMYIFLFAHALCEACGCNPCDCHGANDEPVVKLFSR
jgi:hypothetical protein